LSTNAPVVGLLFGSSDDQKSLQIRDADDIPTEISAATQVQVDLHTAVFPQHSVVGWYRVSQSEEVPKSSDLNITRTLQQHYSPSSSAFCFCLLHVSKAMKPASNNPNVIHKELPISLYSLHMVDGRPHLMASSDWQLETSDPERIAVERVMKEPPPDAPQTNAYTGQIKSMQHSMLNMRARIHLLVDFLEKTHKGVVPPNHNLLRKVQGLLYSLGPLSSNLKLDESASDAKLMTHMAVVAKTVKAVESYTDKFRLVHESKLTEKEVRRTF